MLQSAQFTFFAFITKARDHFGPGHFFYKGKLLFSGQCPRIMRAWCVSILYFPDPLGNATCSKMAQLLSCIEPGEPNGVTITARAQARIVSGGAPRSESDCK